MIHVVGLPFDHDDACAYEGKVTRFCRMMRDRGHDVTLYAPEHYAPDVVTPNATQREFDPSSIGWRLMNEVVVEALRGRAAHRDLLCLIAGLCQRQIVEQYDGPPILPVEFGIGYGGTFCDYRVFESYAWMHTVYGHQQGTHSADGRFYDTVIPNYFDPADFPEGDGAGGYYLFLGRLIDRKGPQIAAETCERLGVPLVLAGAGRWKGYGEHVGPVGPEVRAELLGGAIATFVPTLYVEPFGGVAAESMLCGTPVITSDFGAFTETVRDGRDGYRCHTLAEFIQAARDTPSLDRQIIREHALARWSMESVAPQYERYFARLDSLWGDGWYQTEA